jgi:hypothetical protein
MEWLREFVTEARRLSHGTGGDRFVCELIHKAV